MTLIIFCYMRTKFHLANLLFHNSNLWHTRKTISNFSSNILRLRQNGCHFRDDNFKSIFLNENLCIFIQISLKYVPKGAIDKHSIGLHNGLAPSHYMNQWQSSLLMRLIHICATPSQGSHKATRNWVNIGSGNGLLPNGTKPLPEPMLTYHQ